jgi:hypothetical protein
VAIYTIDSAGRQLTAQYDLNCSKEYNTGTKIRPFGFDAKHRQRPFFAIYWTIDYLV